MRVFVCVHAPVHGDSASCPASRDLPVSIASNKISLRAPLNILQFDAQVSEADEKVVQLPRGRLEKALEPFHPRAHMGKLCTLQPAVWRARYGEKLQKFVSLARAHDPEGKFSNEYTEHWLAMKQQPQ